MHALLNNSDLTPDEPTSSLESTTLTGIVVGLALVTCLFIITLPLLDSLLLAATILALFASAGLAAIFALSRF